MTRKISPTHHKFTKRVSGETRERSSDTKAGREERVREGGGTDGGGMPGGWGGLGGDEGWLEDAGEGGKSDEKR